MSRISISFNFLGLGVSAVSALDLARGLLTVFHAVKAIEASGLKKCPDFEELYYLTSGLIFLFAGLFLAIGSCLGKWRILEFGLGIRVLGVLAMAVEYIVKFLLLFVAAETRFAAGMISTFIYIFIIVFHVFILGLIVTYIEELEIMEKRATNPDKEASKPKVTKPKVTKDTKTTQAKVPANNPLYPNLSGDKVTVAKTDVKK